jgi:adenosylmethionine-8-amino-7-oxononanoate aminotransferase
VIVRPLGNVIVLMPPPAMSEQHLDQLAAAVVRTIADHPPQ